jgi:phospholipid/cholesterol/gamma-HCH transport system substrate-binding protein
MSYVRNEFQVGLFVIVGLGLFIGSLFAIGSEKQIFGTKDRFTTFFSDIKGLNSGAPVSLGGITIGKVGNIKFIPRISNQNIQVELLIDEEYTSHLKSDTSAALGTQGLLGDKFINITGGVSAENLRVDTEIKSIELPDMTEIFEQASGLVTKLSKTVDNVNNVVVDLQGHGVNDFISILSSLRQILSEIENGNGIIADLLSSEDMSSHFNEIAQNIKKVSHQLADGHGMLASLLNDPGGRELIKNLLQAAEQIKKISNTIITLLPDDTPTSSSTLMTLSRIAQNIEDISSALKGGQGTLGALIMDSSLYDNAVEITDTAKRNIILRKAIQQTLH